MSSPSKIRQYTLEERVAWDLYVSSRGGGGVFPITAKDCADFADELIALRRLRFDLESETRTVADTDTQTMLGMDDNDGSFNRFSSGYLELGRRKPA